MFRLRSSTLRLLAFALGTMAVLLAGVLLRRHLRHKGTPEALLERADDLSWKNQWMEAAPIYAKAERLFAQENRPSQALYAHVSQFIPQAESEEIPVLLLDLQQDLALPAAQDPETRLRILVIQGMIETNYNAALARKTWRQVQTLARQQHHYLLMARAMGEQGIAAFLLGDIATAKKLVVRGWLVAKYLHDPAAQVRYASVYGAGLVEMHRYNEAIQVLDGAINTAARSPGIAYPSIAVNSKIDALRGLHRYRTALALCDEASRRLPRARLDAHLFQLLTSKGQIYEDMGRWQDAVQQYTLALDYAHRLSYWRGITQTDGLRASAYEREDDLGHALMSINEAIAANTHLPHELYFVPQNLAIKAEILEKLGRTQESHALYAKSAILIDSLLATAPTSDVERELLTALSQVYSGDFELLSRERKFAQAFDVIEKARGRVEAQSLEHHAVLEPHQPTLQEQRITGLNLQLINSEDSSVRRQLAQSLYDAELQLDDASPAGQTATRPVPLKTVQRDLRPTELVIEYVLDKPHSYALAITRHSVHVYELPSKTTIEEQASEYRRLLRRRQTNTILAQALFHELLSPIPEYRNKSSIVVVPDGSLHLLPFSALMDQGRYTIRTHAFSTAPSATVFYILRNRNRATVATQRFFLGVAAWTQPAEPRIPILRAMEGLERAKLQPLPESIVEVEAIAHLLPMPSTVLLGAQATETNFKNLPLAEYRVVHLALHGYADPEYPDRSALVFAPQDKPTDDGLLQVREIRRLQLNARLVTLSACDTGIGPVGEAGVANLTNAFIEAGADTVVSTLWELEDQSTAQLMTEFYTRLAQHQNIGQALRETQLQFLQAGLAPYYWASFEIVGDPDGTI
ncbi:MAG: CHAT domain-containing protein [Acidobacteriaceae bacterium]